VFLPIPEVPYGANWVVVWEVLEETLPGARQADFLSLELLILAREVSLELRLSMADAIISATASDREAEVITSDVHFAELPRDMVL
jgi:predicted nucleic acid-binding protein